jgi:hypothetical protein
MNLKQKFRKVEDALALEEYVFKIDIEESTKRMGRFRRSVEYGKRKRRDWHERQQIKVEYAQPKAPKKPAPPAPELEDKTPDKDPVPYVRRSGGRAAGTRR